jgi:hypothetical protein
MRLYHGVRLDDIVELGPVLVGPSAYRALYDKTIKRVNIDETLKSNLRQIAGELVRRRRARQAMAGPRWEVFVGNTPKIDDRDGYGKAEKQQKQQE